MTPSTDGGGMGNLEQQLMIIMVEMRERELHFLFLFNSLTSH